MKQCTRCKQQKSTDEFYHNRTMKDGLDPWCKTCASKHARAYRETHSEELKIKKACYHASHQEIDNARSKLYAEIHREKSRARANAWYTTHRERAKQSSKKWRLSHPDEAQVIVERCRANRKNAPGHGLSSGQWIDIQEEYNYCCAYCRQREPLEMDHFVPLAKAGAHDFSNVVPACRSCNSSKNGAFFEDWISRGGNPKKPLVVDPYNTKLFTEIVYIGNEKLSSFVLDAATKELRS